MKRCRFQTFVIVGLLLASFAPTPGKASEPDSAPVGVMESIRKFLGVQPRRVSVGGTRSPGTPTPSVCLLAPGPITQVDGKSRILVVQPKPDIVVGTPLSELQVRSGNNILWSKVATTEGPIPERIGWPITPIKPNQNLKLALRPWDADLGDWAIIELLGATAAEMERTAQILQEITNTDSHMEAIDLAVNRRDRSIFFALLWLESPSADIDFDALRRSDSDNC